MLTLADGTSSLVIANAVPWGRIIGLAGLAPKAMQEREHSCRGFFARSTSVRGVSFNRHQQCSNWPRRYHANITGITRVRCTLGGVAVRRAPELGPVRGDRGELFNLF
jgi:hypothetical protein